MGLRSRAWIPPLRGPPRRGAGWAPQWSRGGRRIHRRACPRASEPPAPPRRLLTPNILVRAERAERTEDIPPRGRREGGNTSLLRSTALSPSPSAPGRPRCGGRDCSLPSRPHRAGGGGRAGGWELLICSNRRAELQTV